MTPAPRRAPVRIGLVSSATDLGVMVVRSLLVKLLRERHPDAFIAVLAEPSSTASVREFFEESSWADACVTIPYEAPRGRWQTLRLAWCLRLLRLDVIVFNPKSAFPVGLARACGISVRAGLARDAATAALLTHPVALAGAPDRDLHWTSVLAAYARALGLDYRGALAHVPFVRVEPGLPPSRRARPSVVVHVGGNAEWNRRWPRARFERLCQLLLREAGAVVTLVGGRHDAPDNAAILEAVGARWAEDARIIDASGSTMAETARLMAAADLFVGNDSGPMNLAVAQGVPVVAIRGADPENFRADRVDPRHVVLSNWQECSRRQTGDETCRLGCPVAYDRESQTYPRCMEAIPLDRVWYAVSAKLGALAPAAASGHGRVG